MAVSGAACERYMYSSFACSDKFLEPLDPSDRSQIPGMAKAFVAPRRQIEPRLPPELGAFSVMSSSVVRGFRTPPHLRFGHWIPAEALGPHTADMVKEQNERSLNGAAPKTEQWFPNGEGPLLSMSQRACASCGEADSSDHPSALCCAHRSQTELGTTRSQCPGITMSTP